MEQKYIKVIKACLKTMGAFGNQKSKADIEETLKAFEEAIKNKSKTLLIPKSSYSVDVICSLEGGFPIMLEVVDTDDFDFSRERQKYYSRSYEDVHIFAGVEVKQFYTNKAKEG